MVREDFGKKRGEERTGIAEGQGEGKENSGAERLKVSRESLAHEYWKRYYAHVFQEKGYQVTLEAPRRHGRADILAVKSAENGVRAGESIAIEVETGKSDVVWNVKQDLLMGLCVMVVAVDDRVFKRVELELGRMGLLIPERVRVIQAGEADMAD